jgi:hypothetical protein
MHSALCANSIKIPTGSTTTLIQHLAKQNREYWKQKEMTTKKGTTKQTSEQLTRWWLCESSKNESF